MQEEKIQLLNYNNIRSTSEVIYLALIASWSNGPDSLQIALETSGRARRLT